MTKQRFTYAQAMQAAIQFLQKGQLDQAQDYCLKILQSASDQAEAWHLLGIVEYQLGHFQQAVEAYQQVIDIQPDSSDAYSNLAMALQIQNRLHEAIEAYRQAISLNPNAVEALFDLAVCLQTQNSFEEAIEAYRSVLALNPSDAPTHNNLGVCLQSLNRLEEARGAFEQAIVLKPDYAKAYNNYGVLLQAQNKMDEAISAYGQAIALSADDIDAYCNLCNAYHEMMDEYNAFDVICKAMQINANFEVKALFIRCLKALPILQPDEALKDLLIMAFSEVWVRPDSLCGLAVQFIKCNPAIRALWEADSDFQASAIADLSHEKLLQCLMLNTSVTDIALERLLTLARVQLLAAAFDQQDVAPDGLFFYSALAQQCFINEYAFWVEEAEAHQVIALQQKMMDLLEQGESIPEIWLVAISAYMPLWSIPGLEALLNQAWPDFVEAVLNQQVFEPFLEWQLRESMPVLTEIDDEVSQLVQKQYEENPYPRWIKAPIGGKRVSLQVHIKQNFPFFKFDHANDDSSIDVLIAGCGSGQHPIHTAQIFSRTHVLAIDLSLASLCYAKRKTQEMGLENIDYAQADIMKLDRLGRQFDLIESLGVLHHMADPFSGLKMLSSLLRPGGFMRLGLYSELARQDIAHGKSFIAENGLEPTPEDIRKFRRIVSFGSVDALNPLKGFSDFYGVSSCRDLLFHAHERCLTLSDIASMLESLGLQFVGFCDAEIRSKYQRRFPEDQMQTDLASWHLFELENPKIFTSMYQFWVYKP